MAFSAVPFLCFPLWANYAMELSAPGSDSVVAYSLLSFNQKFEQKLKKNVLKIGKKTLKNEKKHLKNEKRLSFQSLFFFSFALMATCILYCFHYKFATLRQMIGQDSLSVSESWNNVEISRLGADKYSMIKQTQARHHSTFRVTTFVILNMVVVIQLGRHESLKGGPRYVKNVRTFAISFWKWIFSEIRFALLFVRKSRESCFCIRCELCNGISERSLRIYGHCESLNTTLWRIALFKSSFWWDGISACLMTYRTQPG